MIYVVKGTVGEYGMATSGRPRYKEVDVEVFVEALTPETSQEAELLYDVFKEACKVKAYSPRPPFAAAVVEIKSVTRL